MKNNHIDSSVSPIQRFLNRENTFLILLYLVSFLSYGLLIPWLNFYHDEIPILWFHARMGDTGLFFEGNRPLLEWVYRPLIFLYGANSQLWAVFNVFSRWLHAAGFYWLLKAVWPRNISAWKAAALLILVYPGFQSGFAPIIFSIAFLLFSALLSSFLLNLKAISVDHGSPWLLMSGLALSAFSLFTSEYFFTLELVRYPLIWMYAKNQPPVKRNKALWYSFPFFLLFLASVFWRVQNQGTETTYPITLFSQLTFSFFPALASLFKNMAGDLLYTGAAVWLQAVFPSALIRDQGLRIRFLYAVLSAITFVMVAAVFHFQNKNGQRENRPEKPYLIFLIALFSLLLGGLPFWVAGLPVNLGFFYSRWTIPFMFGACLALASLVDFLIKSGFIRTLIFSLLIALGFGVQFLAANSFRHDFEKQNRFYWQLIWRIPSIQRNTLFLSDMLDFPYENSDQLSMGINFALSRPPAEDSIPFFLYFLPERMGTSLLPRLKAGIPVRAKRYYASFSSSTSDALIIDFQDPACLKILDPEIDARNPNLAQIVRDALPLTNRQRITSEESPPLSRDAIRVIGAEPGRDWCYYFQKADLHHQFKQWRNVEALFLEARAQNLEPRDGREYFPFIEALAHLEKWDQSVDLSQTALRKTDNIAPALCALWERITRETGGAPETSSYEDIIRSELSCQSVN